MVAHHPVLLQSAMLPGDTSTEQLILERTDQEFIPAILDELARPGGTHHLLQTRAKTETQDKVLKLFQPVQRTFNVALFEVVCDVPGRPRFDPARIESAGLVVRRVRRDKQDMPRFDQLEGWCQDGKALKGWLPLSTRDEMDRDPDEARRPRLTAGHAEIDRRLALWRGVTERLSESVTPLFPAPPEVCRALGKTVLFGVVPVSSAEVSESAPDTTFALDEVRRRISPYFKALFAGAVPRAGESITVDDADDRRLKPWINMLGQLKLEFDAFGESPESQGVLAALNEIMVPLARHPLFPFLGYYPQYDAFWPKRPAGELLREHAELLVMRSPEVKTVEMPPIWPRVSGLTANAIAVAVKRSIEARLATIIRPRQPRFDQRRRPDARPRWGLRKSARAMPFPHTGEMYRLRAFVRVRHHDNCPPHTVWSDYSQPFTIAAWYEGAGAPPVQVSLPDPTDRDFLESLRPNVTFAVPGALFKLLQNNDPKKLLTGSGSPEEPSEPGWVCGFNIPIITICAFILLFIMIMLLNMIFWWLPFVKICFPIPRSMAPKASG
jgi:hypothetical protein